MTKEKVHGETRACLEREYSLWYLSQRRVDPLRCATIADNQAAKEKATAPVIEAINVTPLKSRRLWRLSARNRFSTRRSSSLIPQNRPRHPGVPGTALPRVRDVNNAGVKDILIEEGRPDDDDTAVINTTQPVLYQTEPKAM